LNDKQKLRYKYNVFEFEPTNIYVSYRASHSFLADNLDNIMSTVHAQEGSGTLVYRLRPVLYTPFRNLLSPK